MNSNTCRICGTENNNEEYVLKEMMFGTLDEFEYFKCANCGCLQIKEFPEDIKKYYPYNYLLETEYPILKKYLLKKRELFVLSGKGLVGKLLTILFGYPGIAIWFSEAKLNKNDSILDVGCGRGELLLKLKDVGFTNLLGVDPFIEKDIIFSGNFRILKRNLSQIDGSFNWVMFHHSFEHLNNPVETFIMLKNVVKINGNVLIRIPLIDSYAWEIYKTDWVQLDPPRHFFLHTVKSIEYLCKEHGFKIDKIVYDSNSFQFWGSEQYKKQIPLISPDSLFVNSKSPVFSKDVIKNYEGKALELNKNKNGDMACFFLQKSA